jgi:Domain of unknown function (DUF5134)
MDMGGPAWLADVLAVLMLVIAGYCLGRLIVWRARGRSTDVDVDTVHAVMGVGMAAMLVPGLSPVSNLTWAWVFAVAAGWLAWRIVTVYRQAGSARIAQAHYAPHLVMAVAMTYMGVAASGPVRSGSADGGMSVGGSGAGARFPLGALVLALFMFGYAVWLTDQLPGIATVATWRAAPQLALAGPGMPDARAGGRPESPPAAQAAPVVRAAVAAHAVTAGELATAEGGVPRPDDPSDRRVPLSPRLEAGCHIAMAVTMGYMLIVMV